MRAFNPRKTPSSPPQTRLRGLAFDATDLDPCSVGAFSAPFGHRAPRGRRPALPLHNHPEMVQKGHARPAERRNNHASPIRHVKLVGRGLTSIEIRCRDLELRGSGPPPPPETPHPEMVQKGHKTSECRQTKHVGRSGTSRLVDLRLTRVGFRKSPLGPRVSGPETRVSDLCLRYYRRPQVKKSIPLFATQAAGICRG